MIMITPLTEYKDLHTGLGMESLLRSLQEAVSESPASVGNLQLLYFKKENELDTWLLRKAQDEHP